MPSPTDPAVPIVQSATSTASKVSEREQTRARHYAVIATRQTIESILEIKRSEFIGLLRRVESEAQAREFIEETRKTYHDARHVCSALIIGADRDIQRSSDDGEPAGTAGIPMLQALLAQRIEGTRNDTADPCTSNLSDVCAVVVRYFGGVKLGASGLVRAYTEAVTQTVGEASIVRRSRLSLGEVEVPLADAGRVENDLRAAGYRMSETGYSAGGATLRLAVPDSLKARHEAETRLASLTAGARTITWVGTDWLDLTP